MNTLTDTLLIGLFISLVANQLLLATLFVLLFIFLKNKAKNSQAKTNASLFDLLGLILVATALIGCVDE